MSRVAAEPLDVLSVLPVAKKRFNDYPFPYHAEFDLEISTLTNLGIGLGRVALPIAECGLRNADSACRSASTENPISSGSTVAGAPETQNSKPETASETGRWVVMVPFALPGERVRVRIFRNHKNYSEADLVAVVRPATERIAPRCPLFGTCGGCQYQNFAYAGQLRWKQRHVAELLRYMAKLEFPVNAVIPSPCEFGYRSKITPHFECGMRNAEFGTRSENQNLGLHSALRIPRSAFER